MLSVEETRLFRALSPVDRGFLSGRAVFRDFETGDRVFSEGDPGDGMYVVLSGEVEIAVRAAHESERVLTRVPPGDYFGEMAVLDGGTRSASVRATEPARLLFVPSEAVLQLLERSPKLASTFVRVASERLREFNQRFLHELLRAERLTLVERLSRSVVHDFRNPLNVIGIAADLAAEPKASPEARVAARDRIRTQIDMLNSMMHELLEFTRAVHPAVVLAKVRFPEVMEAALSELRRETARRAVALDVPKPPPDVWLRLDPPRITRVLTNIFENAFDAVSDLPMGRLTLRFGATADHVTIKLEDNGPGIPEDLLPRVFEPFVTYGKAHGTGLGLAICEKIIHEHGGRITAASPPGRGAVLTIKLPLPKPGDTDRLDREREAALANGLIPIPPIT